jgi:hypothetical protein
MPRGDDARPSLSSHSRRRPPRICNNWREEEEEQKSHIHYRLLMFIHTLFRPPLSFPFLFRFSLVTQLFSVSAKFTLIGSLSVHLSTLSPVKPHSHRSGTNRERTCLPADRKSTHTNVSQTRAAIQENKCYLCYYSDTRMSE